MTNLDESISRVAKPKKDIQPLEFDGQDEPILQYLDPEECLFSMHQTEELYGFCPLHRDNHVTCACTS